MKNLKRLLFATVLVTAAIVSTPKPALAVVDWCSMCWNSYDCVACCRCDGGRFGDCVYLCGG